MFWTLRVSFMLFLAWVIFLVSPFVALYDLAKAVEARNLERIEQRVNFHALRTSLARQIVGDYLKTPDTEEGLGGFGLTAATNAGAAAVDPYVAKLVTPQALMDMLRKGWPETGAGRPDRATRGLVSLGARPFSLETLRQAWTLFITSESQGFRAIVMPLPENVPKDEQFRLTWRLSGTTWRLTGLDLPRAVREELIRRMPAPAG